MEEFTIRNFFKQWKAILPLAIIFTFIGIIAGIFYNNMQKQSYSVTNEVLVINAADTILPEDLTAIANSKLSVGDHAIKEAKVDKSCSYKSSKSGNVVKITSTCSSSGEDAQKLTESVIASFSTAISEIYDNENLVVKVISRGASEEQITTTNRILYVCLPGLAGLAVSAFIAFVKLDHISSKKRKE